MVLCCIVLKCTVGMPDRDNREKNVQSLQSLEAAGCIAEQSIKSFYKGHEIKELCTPTS